MATKSLDSWPGRAAPLAGPFVPREWRFQTLKCGAPSELQSEAAPRIRESHSNPTQAPEPTVRPLPKFKQQPNLSSTIRPYVRLAFSIPFATTTTTTTKPTTSGQLGPMIRLHSGHSREGWRSSDLLRECRATPRTGKVASLWAQFAACLAATKSIISLHATI